MKPAVYKVRWEEYSKGLFSHGYGYPLPSGFIITSERGIHVGDVGWFRIGGTLRPMFNAMGEQGYPLSETFTAPPGFERLDPAKLDVRHPSVVIPEGVVCTSNLQVVDDSQPRDVGKDQDARTVRVSFNEPQERSAPSGPDGAYLLLQQPVEGCEIASTGPSRQVIIDYMRENAHSWYKQAIRHCKGQYIQAEEMLLVSGTVKTPRYTAGIIDRDELSSTKDALVGFASTDFAPATYRSTLAAKSSNQCVFFHYYKMKMRPHWWHQLSRIAWWPSKSDRNGWIRLRKMYDPVSYLLDYILQNSTAKMAIASDTDLVAVFQDGNIPHDIQAALKHASPDIVVDTHGVGTVRFIS